jgi:hypothetical protein
MTQPHDRREYVVHTCAITPSRKLWELWMFSTKVGILWCIRPASCDDHVSQWYYFGSVGRLSFTPEPKCDTQLNPGAGGAGESNCIHDSLHCFQQAWLNLRIQFKAPLVLDNSSIYLPLWHRHPQNEWIDLDWVPLNTHAREVEAQWKQPASHLTYP